MDTSGFYKQTETGWIYVPNIYATPTYMIKRELKDTYTYPINGWNWYDEEPFAYTQWQNGKEILKNSLAFGKSLVEDFLVIMRAQPTPLGTTNSLLLLDKFSTVKTLAEIGDITNAKVVLEGLEVDALFPQELKDLFLGKINDYLGE